MSKIRTLVAHDNEEVRKTIADSMKRLDYVEVIATAKDGIDAYNKIVRLKPEMVFAEYNFDDMNGIELIKKSKEKLKNNFPIFNIIVDELSKSELDEVLEITDHKVNALVRQPYADRVSEIMEIYKKDNLK